MCITDKKNGRVVEFQSTPTVNIEAVQAILDDCQQKRYQYELYENDDYGKINVKSLTKNQFSKLETKHKLKSTFSKTTGCGNFFESRFSPINLSNQVETVTSDSDCDYMLKKFVAPNNKKIQRLIFDNSSKHRKLIDTKCSKVDTF